MCHSIYAYNLPFPPHAPIIPKVLHGPSTMIQPIQQRPLPRTTIDGSPSLLPPASSRNRKLGPQFSAPGSPYPALTLQFSLPELLTFRAVPTGTYLGYMIDSHFVWLGSPRGHFEARVVAREHGDAVGAEVGELGEFAVAFRGRGLGDASLDALFD
jgi:hypothetical protein